MGLFMQQLAAASAQWRTVLVLGIREAYIACRGVAAVSGFTGLKGGRCWLLWASASAQYLFSAGSSLQWVALSKSVNGAGSMFSLC
jgi:hypothetical protein